MRNCSSVSFSLQSIEVDAADEEEGFWAVLQEMKHTTGKVESRMFLIFSFSQFRKEVFARD